jgi:hypothetical protein
MRAIAPKEREKENLRGNYLRLATVPFSVNMEWIPLK